MKLTKDKEESNMMFLVFEKIPKEYYDLKVKVEHMSIKEKREYEAKEKEKARTLLEEQRKAAEKYLNRPRNPRGDV